MGGKSNIEWTEVTWNPTTGCDKVSPGCKNCYAEAWAKMQFKRGIHQYRNDFKLTLAQERLSDPISWRKPKKVFVNSMSDLFHENIPTSYIEKVFSIMEFASKHTYQILTKRIERVAQLKHQLHWPNNVWLGVSVENNETSSRIEILKKIPAQVKFVSFEPLLENITNVSLRGIDWVIVGGESGSKGRRLEKEWVKNIQKCCEVHHVSFFFKQWGKREFNPDQTDPTISKHHPLHARGGCMIDKLIFRNYP